MSCQAALPLGAHGADTVLALLRGRAPRQLSVCMSGQCISLGRRRGLIQIARRDDSPRRLALRGRLAARVKESVSTSTITQLRRARPSYQWLPGPQPPVRTRQAASE
jgi:NADH dehydrogenase FAD-containing subunit